MQVESNEYGELLERLKAYCFPAGEDAARGVRGIKTTQRGEFRMSSGARWTAFTAEEFVDATSTAFCWEARIGTSLLTSVHVTDAYENGRGQLVLKKGPIQLKKLHGSDVDKGELQRYLGYISYCPAMLLNNRSLQLTAAGPSTLRVRDRQDQTNAWVDCDIDKDGRPSLAHCIRPMAVGRRVIPTPWSASGSEPHEWEGMRIMRRLEASWNPPEGSFAYIRIELTSVTVLR
jgi:hypothetical protein